MFLNITLFEIKLGLRKISFWVYCLIFFAIAFLIVNVLGGAFTGVSAVMDNTKWNAPEAIAGFQASFTILGTVICAALFGNAAYRDYEYKIHPLIFTKPIRPYSYFLGRFSGALFLNICIHIFFSLGLFIAFIMPYLDQDGIGPLRFDAFVQPFFIFVVPNIFFIGSLLFTLAILTKRMLPTYLGSVILLFGYLTAGNLMTDIETRWIASLLDPFGGEAVSESTRYWTPAEKNQLLVPLDGWLLLNRIIWVSFGLIILCLGLNKFDFTHITKTKKNKIEKKSLAEVNLAAISLPRSVTVFGFSTSFLQLKSKVKTEIKRAFRDSYFLGIIGTAVGFLILNQSAIGSFNGVKTLPVTYQVLSVLSGSFALFMLIIITFYSGQIVWRESELGADSILDAHPVPNWIPMLSKLIALILIPGILLLILMLVGIGIQTWHGFYDYDVHLYIKRLFLLEWTDYMLLCVLSFAVQTVVTNKYVGHFIIVLYFIFGMFKGQLGFTHTLYYYGSGAGATFSDMNGFAPYINRVFWYKLYWGSFAILLAFFSNLMWRRGLVEDFNHRLRKIKRRLSKNIKINLVFWSLVFSGSGIFIFYNTNILNDFFPPKHFEKQSAEYEKLYKKYEGTIQPKITSVNCSVDIFPSDSRLEFSGTYKLKNKHDISVDTVFCSQAEWGFDTFEWSRPSELVHNDSVLGMKMYAFDPPIEPGDVLELNFSGSRSRKGFKNDGVDKLVVKNGTMIQSSLLFPNFGYNSNREIRQKMVRKKYGLQERRKLPKFDDVQGNKYGLIGRDADWVDFEAIVSTEKGQIAMAPGYLQREWDEGSDRKYFHYKMDKPILNFFTFVSGRYDILKEEHNGISLEIYHHPKHVYNLKTMMHAMKRSIDYYSSIYGPYPYRQCRILEFPRYNSFAQSFPNTIPFSESMGFVMDIDPEDPEDLDMPFWVTAHEMGHQWWPHQLSGGSVKGSNFMSEGLSEYSAVSLLAIEKGEKQLRKFLKYELDQYLEGRAFDSEEPNIISTEGNEQYIVYNKAGLILYTLSNLIGEKIFNKSLGQFIDNHRYQYDPYPNVGQLIASIKKNVPENMEYLLTDSFEKITLYENKAKSANATENLDGTYNLTLEVEAKKVYSDSLGVQTSVPINDWLEIGVFSEVEKNGLSEEIPIYVKKVLITDSLSTFSIRLDKKPTKAGIDPLNKFIDRDSKDNLITVSFK